MKTSINMLMLVSCFALCNLQADDLENMKQSRTVTINITAQVITPEAAVIMLGEHAIKNPFELILDLINNHFNDFIFTLNNITYIVESNLQPNEVIVDTPSENCITTNILAHVIPPLQASAMLIQASALFFAAHAFHKPADFLTFIFQQSPEGFVFTIDNMTYIIRS